MQKDDAVYAGHMLDTARKAVGVTVHGLQRHSPPRRQERQGSLGVCRQGFPWRRQIWKATPNQYVNETKKSNPHDAKTKTQRRQGHGRRPCLCFCLVTSGSWITNPASNGPGWEAR